MSTRKVTRPMSTAPGKKKLQLKMLRCDNHYVIEADCPEDKGKLVIEFEQERGFEHKMFKDEREKEKPLSLKWVLLLFQKLLRHELISNKRLNIFHF